MPEILPTSIVSFSSEDKEYPASNLLKASGFNKWKCANAGEKNATVEFQLAQAERINQIDIGNEGSAFVEVLVRRTGASSDSFQVLLPSSSFMSPAEAKSRSGQNRVRIFKADRLARSLVEEKWDRIRVVCSQPFVRTENYGLAFIRFYSVASDADVDAGTGADGAKKKNTLAGFVLRDEGADEEKKELSLFAKKKEKSEEEEEEEPAAGPSIATQIRSASKVAEKELAKSQDENERKEAPRKPAPVKKRSSDDSEGSDQPTAKKQKVKRDNSSESRSSSSTVNSAKKNTNGKKADAQETPAFNALMKGVVFCMSGYENPQRSQLRDKAQAMGGQYRANWGRECTHLICAFVDTPKYREVTGKGRIVRAKWIEECHRRRSLLPWRDFRLGRAPSPPGSDSEKKARRRAVGRPSLPDSSEEEEEEEKEKEEEEKLPPRRARTAPKARRESDVSAGDDISAASDSDSEAELRRRKQQRMRQKRKRKYGSDEESEDEWRPDRRDAKEETDSDPDAEVGKSDSDSDWAASKKKAEKKKKKGRPKSPKKRRSFRKSEEEDSEEEILPSKNRATAPSNRSGSPPPPRRKRKSPAKSPSKSAEKSPAKSPAESGEESEEKKTPEKSPGKTPTKEKPSLLDGSDSDSGWAPIRRKKGTNEGGSTSRTPTPKKGKEKEENEAVPSSPEALAGDLPDLFPDTSFFFYGALPEDTERLLRRVIVAYGGKVVPYMSEQVKYVITSSEWDDNFDDALADNSSLLFVRPQWLFECDRRRKFVPYQKFQVVG